MRSGGPHPRSSRLGVGALRSTATVPLKVGAALSWSPHLYVRQAHQQGIPTRHALQALAQARRVQEKGLAAVLSLNHLALMTGVSREFLFRIVSRADDTTAYRHFNMKKRSPKNGYRRIHVPHPGLCRVQRWIVENILSRLPVHSQAYAYVRGRLNPVFECANIHCGAKWLVRLDIENFFDSISEASVYKIYKDFGYSNLVSFELARISTWTHEPNQVDGPYALSERRRRYRYGTRWIRTSTYGPYGDNHIGSLPQGAPTSPALANFYCRELDEKLKQLAHSHGFVYSRYSDDIYFSAIDSSRPLINELVQAASSMAWEYRLKLNVKKTRISPPGARKIVLGLLVDGTRPRLSKHTRAKIRQHIYSLGHDPIGHTIARRFSSVWALVRHVRGVVEFAASIEPDLGLNYRSELTKVIDKIRSIH